MGYYADLVTPLQLIPQKVTEWIKQETVNGGLLEEIDKVWDTYRTAGTVESYEIWINKEDWSFQEGETYSMNNSEATINYPFEIAIILDLDDEETAEQKAIQLQAKAIMSIFKNYTPNIFNDIDLGWVNYFDLQEGYNDGSIQVVNRDDDVIIKGFRLILNVTIDWLECKRKYDNNH